MRVGEGREGSRGDLGWFNSVYIRRRSHDSLSTRADMVIELEREAMPGVNRNQHKGENRGPLKVDS